MPLTSTFALEYHDVVTPNDPDASGFRGRAAAPYKLSPDVFQSHLEALASQPVRVGERVLDAWAATAQAPPVLLTFDDGGVSAKLEIADRVERYGWYAHFFVTTDFIGQPGFLTGTDLRELHRRGHIIGSHSCSHPTRMSACPDERLNTEWRDSVEVLAGFLGEPVLTASLPGGAYSRRVAQSAAAAGIRVLFTSAPVSRVSQVGDCAVVGRFTLRRGHTAADVLALVSSSPTARIGQWLRWNTRQAAKAVLRPAYLLTRERSSGA